jgi:hypothetical protein
MAIPVAVVEAQVYEYTLDAEQQHTLTPVDWSWLHPPAGSSQTYLTWVVSSDHLHEYVQSLTVALDEWLLVDDDGGLAQLGHSTEDAS